MTAVWVPRGGSWVRRSSNVRTVDVALGGAGSLAVATSLGNPRDALVVEVDQPTASTTGVPAGTVLVARAGDVVVSTPGATLEGMDITGRVIVRAAGVTVKSCRVRGASALTAQGGLIDATHTAASGLRVIDTEIRPDYPSLYTDGILGHDFLALRCNIYGCVDPVGVYNQYNPLAPVNVTIQQCWLHDLAYFTPDPTHSDNITHNDGVQSQGGSGMRVVGCRIDANYSTTFGTGEPFPTGLTQQLSAVMLSPAASADIGTWAITGCEINGNWVYGGKIAINAGHDRNAGADLGVCLRNRFDGTQYADSTTSAPHTIDIQAGAVLDCGEGDPTDQNVFMDTAPALWAGQPVLVRRNA